MAPHDWPSPATLIPDLLRQDPAVRAVLDRYGLRGCGGPLGPSESLEFFARAHDVPLDQLRRELQEARTEGRAGPAAPAYESGAADTIYRPFFRSGIAVVLTLGAAWGAYLLLRIGLAGSFRAAGLQEINAHGHAQIFGWVGLFVMGFAYQAFPRFKHTALAFPRWAHASLWLMLGGLVCRSLLQSGVTSWPWLGVPALAASAVEVAAIAIFVFIVAATLQSSGKPLAHYDYYILAALAWFFIQGICEAVYFAATWLTTDRETLLELIATWQGPLREIQIYGFAGLMILGVSQRIFHHFYNLPAPNARKSLAALVALNAAIVGLALGFILMGLAGHAWASLWYASVWVLTVATVVLVLDWRLFSPAQDADRSLKFLRTAYVWLFISLAMLVFLPLYQFVVLPALAPQSSAAEIGFSHAYYGSVRHAVTVGFISLMIVGVAAKVVPTLGGIDVHRLGGLWIPYVLINTGCAWRVVTQILTDFSDRAYAVTGVSGVLEWTGLAIWGVHLWRLMGARALEARVGRTERSEARRHADSAGVASLHPPYGESSADSAGVASLRPPYGDYGNSSDAITAGSVVGDVLDRHPELLETFIAFGFLPLKNPVLRKTLARHTTIDRACRMLDVDTSRLLAALREKRGHSTFPPPIVDQPPGTYYAGKEESQ